jgi:UDP-N-acetylmuramoylalanine--D-glutamate ligase
MAEAVEEAWKSAKLGDIVLMSPASASFGMFKDYADRGEQFIKAVNGLRG